MRDCFMHFNLYQRKPQFRRDAQGLKVFVIDVAEAIQNQSAGTKDLTGPAQT